MSLREEVIAVLRSSEAARISFSFNSINSSQLPAIVVAPWNFFRVASGIESGQIRIETEGISPNNAGEYDGTPRNGGVLYLRPLTNQTRKAVVIHEAVHASFDLDALPMAPIDDEVAGFLAEFLYLRFASCSYADILLAFPNGDRFCEAFWRISGAIINNRGVFSDAQIDHLRERIREQPAYSYVLCSPEESCFYRTHTYNG